MSRHIRIIGLGLIFAVCATSTLAAENDYPAHTVKVIVPVAAGGAPDVVARILANKLAADWKQPFIVENRPGAGERIGAEAVAKAEPDGYTLLVTPPGPLAITQLLNSNLPFDPQAFEPISILTRGYLVLLASPKADLPSVQSAVAYAKSHPGKLSYASPGIGTLPHLTGEMFRLSAGIETTHVAYKGLAPALTDLLSGQVDIMFDNLGNSLPHIREQRLKPLGVSGVNPSPDLPGVPPIGRTYPDVQATSWFAMAAPPHTPPALTARISAAVSQALKAPDVERRLRDLSFTAVGSSPMEAREFIRAETARWRRVVLAAGIHAE